MTRCVQTPVAVVAVCLILVLIPEFQCVGRTLKIFNRQLFYTVTDTAKGRKKKRRGGMQTQVLKWRARGSPCPMLQIRGWGNASFVTKKASYVPWNSSQRAMSSTEAQYLQCNMWFSYLSEKKKKKTSTQRLCLHRRLDFSSVDAKPGLNAIFSVPKDVWLWFKILKQLEDCLCYLAQHPQSCKHHWQDKINKVPHVFSPTI